MWKKLKWDYINWMGEYLGDCYIDSLISKL